MTRLDLTEKISHVEAAQQPAKRSATSHKIDRETKRQSPLSAEIKIKGKQCLLIHQNGTGALEDSSKLRASFLYSANSSATSPNLKSLASQSRKRWTGATVARVEVPKRNGKLEVAAAATPKEEVLIVARLGVALANSDAYDN